MKNTKKIMATLTASAMLMQFGAAVPITKPVITTLSAAAEENVLDKAKELTLGKGYEDQTESSTTENWYKFTTDSDGYFTVDFSRDVLNNSDTLWKMTIYQFGDGLDEVATWFMDGNTLKSTTCELGMPAGEYVIKIATNGYYSWSDEKYTVKVNFTADDHYETEFNNSFQTADKIALGETYSGTNCKSDDDDWYKFTTDSDGYFTIDFSRDVLNNTDTLWKMTIYQLDDSLDEIITWYMDGNSLKTTTCELGVPAGDYVIKIATNGYYSWSNERYSIKVNFTANDHYETEFNNGFQTADKIALGETYSGTNCKSDDDDWYKFTTDSDGYFTVDFSRDVLNNTDTLWKMTVYQLDDSLDEIATWYMDGNSLKSTTCELGVPAGDYVIKIATNGYYSWSNERYSIKVNFTEDAHYETEFNNSFQTADTISLNETISGSTFNLGDKDWYTFEIDERSSVSINFEMPFMEGTDTYWNINLYAFTNSLEEVSGYYVEGGKTLFSVSDLTLDAGTYYLEVTPHSSYSYSTSTYSLTVSTNQSSSVNFGDLNGDSEVNASDAALLLTEAALLGAGQAGEFTQEQLAAADVNKDGEVNASDAAVILSYAAACGAGETSLPLENWVAEQS